MADFPDWRVESPEDSAFKWLCEGQYMKAILSFESWILRTKHTWTDDKEKKLGDLYRGLAEAYWHVHCPDDALEQILRCVWENCHEFSERHVSRWTILADKQVENPEFKLKGYQIALQFVPPHDLFKRSHLLSKMLLFCCESGSSFQIMAGLFMCAANEIEVCEQEDLAKIWLDCGKKILPFRDSLKISVECFTLAQRFLPSDEDKMKARLCFLRAKTILAIGESSQYAQAKKDAQTYVALRPSKTKGYSLLWECSLRCHNYKEALVNFGIAQETLKDRQEEKYQEFYKFFTSAVSQKASEVFKEECPVAGCLVERLISECTSKETVKYLSVLFLDGCWATTCDASCVPLDMVLKSDIENRDELVKILLEKKALPNGLSNRSKSPLSICIEEERLDLALILLQYGADEKELVQKDGETALHASLQIALNSKKGNLEIFQFFLDGKRSDAVDVQDKDGNTLLHLLCQGRMNSKKREAMNLVLRAGAKTSIVNNKKESPIDLLCKQRFFNDERITLLSSASECFESSSSCETNTPEQESKNEGNEVEGERNLTERSKNISRKRKIDKKATSKQSVLSTNSIVGVQTESLSVIRRDIGSMIQNLDIRDWIKKNESTEVVERSENPKNESGQTQSDRVMQLKLTSDDRGLVQEDESRSFLRDEEQCSGISDTTEYCIKGAFEGLPWEVECTAEVRKVLESERLEPWKIKLFVEKVRTLALGRHNWSQDLCKILKGVPKNCGMRLYEAKLTKAARIIWECAVAFSPQYSYEDEKGKVTIYSEVIRVWDIVFDHDNISRAKDNIVTSFIRGKEGVARKELKRFSRGGASPDQGPNLYCRRSRDFLSGYATLLAVPKENVPRNEANEDQVTFFPPVSHNDNEYQVLKFYHLSTAMIQTILKQQPCNVVLDFPFRVTEEEHAIINFEPSPQSSIILIGRSGTGKTTCILYRLWRDFENYWGNAVKSGPLMPKKIGFPPEEQWDSDSSKVNVPAGGQLDENEDGCSREVTSKDDDAIASFLSPSPESEESLEHFHQLFVTKNGVLCQQISKNFIALSHASSFVEHSTKAYTVKPVKLQEIDDSAAGWPQFLNARDFYFMLDASLPEPYFFPRNDDGSLGPRAQNWGEEDNRFSDIPLLEEDDAKDDSDEEDEHTEVEISSLEKDKEMVLVSYDIFEKQLWPMVCKKKKDVNFHPSLVWMEIRSFIKGSYEALHTKNGYLCSEKYQEIGQKRAPNFTADREAIYKLFLSYEKVRKSSNMFDENDLVFDLYRRLRQGGVPDWSIHKLYVDETQDFTQAELMLLISCCRDPNGIFLTGDTAQSIMQGISFRFEDLRSLFYYMKKNCKDEGAQTQVVVPELKKLIWNYRSHSGILNLASSVVSILQEYFPESFDKLDQDQGQLDGPKPVLLESCSPSDLAIILRGYKRKTTAIEFGAHQAILVASNEARERLPEELSHALVLTIYEAKGLEFDDVLVYNFFKDSKARIEWGTVTHFLLNVSESETGNSLEFQSRPVLFDPDRYKLLKAELKQLYTAVTRARANVWFFDEDEENRRPVFEYFEQLGLAEVVSLKEEGEESTSGNQPLEKMFPKESSLMEWQNQGDFFYSKKLWNVAEKCFKKSGNEDMSRKCKAYLQADYALSLRNDPQRQKDEFLRAAYQFLQCKMIRQTKACLYNAREHSLFASLLQKLGKERKAATVFERNGHYLEASQCLEATADYRGAVDTLLRGSLCNKAIEVVKRFSKLTSEEQKLTKHPGRTLDELYLELAEFNRRRGNTADMSSSLQHVESTDTRIEFLMKHRFLEDAVKELEKLGRSREAANIMRENGSFLIAAKYAQTSGNSVLAADCIFAHVRVSKTMTDEERQARLEEAKQLYEVARKKNSVGEVLLRQAKLSRDAKKVLQAMEIFSDPSVSNTCSNLECVETLVEMVGDDSQILEKKNWTLVKLVENVIKLILSLDIPAPDFKTQKALERCEEHFGIYREGDPKTRVVRFKEGDRFLSISLALEKDTLAGSKWELNLQHVRTRIAENLLHRLINLIPKVRKFLRKEIDSHKTCQMFLVGMPCSDESCQYQHCLPTKESTDSLFWALSHEVYLDAQANDFWKLEEKYSSHETGHNFGSRRPLSTSTKESGKPFPKDSYQSCRNFLQFFFSPIGISSSICSGKYISLVRSRKFIQQSLYKCVDKLWRSQLTRRERISDINCFFTVSNLLQLLGSPPSTILSWIKKEEEHFWITLQYESQNRKPRIPQSVGMVIEENSRRCTLFSRWWEDSKRLLHVHGRILDSGHYAVRRFLKMSANPGKQLPFPDPKNFLSIMEYQFVVHVALAIFVSSLSLRVCLPRSYLSVVIFWDALNCTTRNHFEIHRAVELFRFSSTTIARVKRFLGDTVSLMLGGYSPKFNVLDHVLRTQSCINSGETERAVILVLTMLCNCGQLLSTENEIILLRNLFAQVPDEVILPKRISSCLEQVRQAKGLRQIVAILQDLLKNRKEELCDVYWRFRTIRGDEVDFKRYIDTFNTDADTLSTLIHETPELPGDDALEPEEEHGLHIEEDQPTSDLDPSSNSMLQDIEKEEAMRAELWKKEMTSETGEHAEVDFGQFITQNDISSPFVNAKVDKSGCGVCNVFFSNEQTGIEENVEQANESSHYANDFESHLSENSPHWKKLEQFNAYEYLIIQKVVPLQFMFETLVKKVEDQLEIAGKQNMPLSILSNMLNKVKMTFDALRELTSTIQQEGNWAETTLVERAVMALTKSLEACQEELQKETQPTDDDSMNSAKDVEDVEDVEYLHVPGLKKRKN